MYLKSVSQSLIFSLVLSALWMKPSVLQAQQDYNAAVQTIPNTAQQVTPLAPRGARFAALNPGLADFPNYIAGQAVTTVVSPNQKTLLILTSGYNRVAITSGPNQGNENVPDSNEYVFVFDITNKIPVQKQVVQVPNTYNGITFDPSGKTFYVTGGVNDNVHIYDLGVGGWAERAGSPVGLGHAAGVGLLVPPCAAGVAISADGTRLLVANYYNDSVTLLTKSANAWSVASELDLRPGKINPANKGVPGGEYPFWVSIVGNNTAYVSTLRDREIDVVNLAGGTLSLTTRIPLKGQPNKMTLNAAQTTLFVAEDELDAVAAIDTATNKVIREIPAGAPAGLLPAAIAGYTGHNTDSVTLSPDGNTLYVSNGNTNEIAVVDISGGIAGASVTGLIPTGWYPNSVSLSADGRYMYVLNGKSITGPNPGFCQGNVVPGRTSAVCNSSNHYDLQLIKAGFQSFPTPTAGQLTALTQQVAANNNFQSGESQSALATMTALRNKIQHVIYIVRENRTYDQVLGDLQ